MSREKMGGRRFFEKRGGRLGGEKKGAAEKKNRGPGGNKGVGEKKYPARRGKWGSPKEGAGSSPPEKVTRIN